MAAVTTNEGFEVGVSALISAQASINLRDKLGNTALHYAKASGYESVAKLILDAGGTE